MINLKVMVTPHHPSEDEPILLIDVNLKNVGKTPWLLGQAGLIRGDQMGLSLWVLQYDNLNAIDWKDEGSKPSQHIIDWTKEPPELDARKFLVKNYNLLGLYSSFVHEAACVWLRPNPGIEYHEPAVVPVEQA